MDIKDKVVIVTGGSSGLGLASAKHLAAQGAKIAVFDRNQQAGQALLEELKTPAIFVSVDVSDVTSVKAGIDQVLDAFAAIHVCINCAGIVRAGKTLGRDGALELESFAQVINVNLLGTFNVLRLAAEQMSKNKPNRDGERGVIINTASIAAFDGQMGQAAYSASKAAIAGMTLPIARDLAKFGIRIMSIAPGVFDTPMMRGMSEQVREPLIQLLQQPNRFGEPREFAALAAHIIDNPYLNGEVIRLDGAIRM